MNNIGKAYLIIVATNIVVMVATATIETVDYKIRKAKEEKEGKNKKTKKKV